MTKEQIIDLLAKGKFPEKDGPRELIETHISWVVLCDQYVYKIKKPVQYSFLDFSTPALREHFCQREIELNKRLTENIYLDVLPVFESHGRYSIGSGEGKIIDHAVRMLKMDTTKQMDVLLAKDKVSEQAIVLLAKKVASFHKKTQVIYHKNYLDVQEMFNDLAGQKDFLCGELGEESSKCISRAIEISDNFIEKHKSRLEHRLREGFFRDCHGDLHSRNIFLLPAPQPFDCIEFNDDLRHIDVLNEIAFLCMDLDVFGREDLAALFVDKYNQFFPAMISKEDRSLFIYYKSYRANIRAKVNSLRAGTAADESEKKKALLAADKYLKMMEGYLNQSPYPPEGEPGRLLLS
jgi:aminoglycoside phosphotransferase family enzyme